MATAITEENVEKTVYEALAAVRRRRVDEITREATFEDLDVDSLDLAELSQIIEDEYGVALKGDDVGKIKTVGDAIDLVVQPSGHEPRGRHHRRRRRHPAGGRRPHAARALERRASSASRTARARPASSSPPSTSRSRRPAAPTASPSSRWSRATRRWPRPAGPTSCRTTPTASPAILGTGIGGIGTLERGKDMLMRVGAEEGPAALGAADDEQRRGRRGVHALQAARPLPRHRLRLLRRRGRDRHAAKMMIQSGTGRRRRHRRLGGGAHAALQAPRSARSTRCRDSGISRPFDARPRRLRDGRGRRGPRARGRREGGRARGAKILGTLRATARRRTRTT